MHSKALHATLNLAIFTSMNYFRSFFASAALSMLVAAPYMASADAPKPTGEVPTPASPQQAAAEGKSPAEAKAPTKKAPAQRKIDPAMAPVTDQPGLPRVLLIGDSISIGYTVAVQKLLAGKANVHRIPTNGGPTTNGLSNIGKWLGSGKWDVIHFNWGLHDIKYVADKSTTIAPVGQAGTRQQVKIEDYEKNLATLVEQLKATGARLIWCNTTPVPEGVVGRVVGDEVKYNEAAARVMTRAGVSTNDLYTYAKANLAEIQKPADVHFSTKGSEYLAKQVAEAITASLAKGK